MKPEKNNSVSSLLNSGGGQNLLSQNLTKAQFGHTKFLSDFSVPKITKVVKISTLEKPRKPLISLQ